MTNRSLSEYVERPEIQVGEYTVREGKGDIFLIENKEGEIAEVSQEELEEQISDLFKATF